MPLFMIILGVLTRSQDHDYHSVVHKYSYMNKEGRIYLDKYVYIQTCLNILVINL